MIYVPIKLDKTRNLGYGMRGISRIEKHFKKPMAKIDMENITMEDTAVFIWAGLVHEERDLTPDRVMDLIDEYSNLPTVSKAMNEAMEEFFGEGEEEKNVAEAVTEETSL